MTRETLHQLIEDLDERDVPTARRVLSALRDSRCQSGPLHALDTAPEDDEAETSDERATVEEAMREIRQGEAGATTDDLKRELGIA